MGRGQELPSCRPVTTAPPPQTAETCRVRRPAAGGWPRWGGPDGDRWVHAPSLLPAPPRALGPAVTPSTAGKCGCSRKRRKTRVGGREGAGAGAAGRGALTGRWEPRQQQQQQRRERPAPQPPHGSLIILRLRGLRLRAARRGREEARAGGAAAGAAGGGAGRAGGEAGGGGGSGGGAGARLSALRPRPSRRGGGPG